MVPSNRVSISIAALATPRLGALHQSNEKDLSSRERRQEGNRALNRSENKPVVTGYFYRSQPTLNLLQFLKYGLTVTAGSCFNWLRMEHIISGRLPLDDCVPSFPINYETWAKRRRYCTPTRWLKSAGANRKKNKKKTNQLFTYAASELVLKVVMVVQWDERVCDITLRNSVRTHFYHVAGSLPNWKCHWSDRLMHHQLQQPSSFALCHQQKSMWLSSKYGPRWHINIYIYI